MKRGKKAQFYIIAAIIIIAILIGAATYSNYARKKRALPRIYDLGKELGLETGYIYDYGVFKSQDLDNLTDRWTDVYLNYTKDQAIIEDWIFVYGDDGEMTAVTFTLLTSGEIGIETGGTTSSVKIETMKKIKTPFQATGEEIEMTFQNFTYKFELKAGENFFFVITSEDYTTTS